MSADDDALFNMYDGRRKMAVGIQSGARAMPRHLGLWHSELAPG